MNILKTGIFDVSRKVSNEKLSVTPRKELKRMKLVILYIIKKMLLKNVSSSSRKFEKLS